MHNLIHVVGGNLFDSVSAILFPDCATANGGVAKLFGHVIDELLSQPISLSLSFLGEALVDVACNLLRQERIVDEVVLLRSVDQLKLLES